MRHSKTFTGCTMLLQKYLESEDFISRTQGLAGNVSVPQDEVQCFGKPNKVKEKDCFLFERFATALCTHTSPLHSKPFAANTPGPPPL